MAPPGHAVLPRDSRPSGQKKPRAAPGPSPPLPRNSLRAWECLEAGSDGAFIGNDLCLPPGGKTGAAVHVLTCTRRAGAHGPEHRNPPQLAENKGQRAGMGQRAGLWAGDEEGGSRTISQRRVPSSLGVFRTYPISLTNMGTDSVAQSCPTLCDPMNRSTL